MQITLDEVVTIGQYMYYTYNYIVILLNVCLIFTYTNQTTKNVSIHIQTNKRQNLMQNQLFINSIVFHF